MENLRETYRKPYRTACTFPLHPAGTSLTSCGASYGTQHNSHPSLPLPRGYLHKFLNAYIPSFNEITLKLKLRVQ